MMQGGMTQVWRRQEESSEDDVDMEGGADAEDVMEIDRE